MKKFFIAILIIVVFTIIIAFFEKYKIKEPNIQLKDKNVTEKILFKGLIGAVDFSSDEEGNFYIAYNNRIQFIDSLGKSYNIFYDRKMNITSIEYYNKKIYFASGNSIYTYDLHKKINTEIINNLPNFGDYSKSLIKINKDYLYITIGAATNSGVVGLDNNWIKEYPFSHDISPFKITLKGRNFNGDKTGSFTSYNTKNIAGQIVSGHFPGNASIIIYNLQNGVTATFAWGIRNVKGFDFDSRGRLIASVGGMEDRGLRGIKGDTDYIYVINSKGWYGWPDYSGGDPINSPRFKDSSNNTVGFIMDNHPTTNPSAPIYIHNSVSSLKSIAIDTSGQLGEADTIYFYDEKERKIYSLNAKGVLNEKIEFNINSKISSIKYLKNQIIVLDANKGAIYSLGKNE
ncbi:hypothetical protein CLHOM_00420 [Clostridium homopropionicum DSM 5847]|uniref:Uncharacterized protein n=1 Tax=Clostridium homopropionicum DSM 5847 TaxID=1121318 RepID=A0A0L6ZEH0_9CLOT|nr:hypothetical protein [Clostridium homopropionicum]KOA21371.1 hypothetical protein CLHOM_00420 [Clostridium homopropionicum DSM 5847]SFG12057.1 hypothetical protein SAMN04488501_105184 [Clostridium homopropionicum]